MSRTREDQGARIVTKVTFMSTEDKDHNAKIMPEIRFVSTTR